MTSERKMASTSSVLKQLADLERSRQYSDQEFQRVSRELAKLEYEHNELVAQRNELIWSLEQHNSIKKLAKILAVRLHQRILFSINKLQQPRRRVRPAKLASGDLEKLSTAELLQTAKSYDDRYLRIRNPYLSIRYYFYLLVKSGYRVATRVPKALYKSIRYLKRKVYA